MVEDVRSIKESAIEEINQIKNDFMQKLIRKSSKYLRIDTIKTSHFKKGNTDTTGNNSQSQSAASEFSDE